MSTTTTPCPGREDYENPYDREDVDRLCRCARESHRVRRADVDRLDRAAARRARRIA